MSNRADDLIEAGISIMEKEVLNIQKMQMDLADQAGLPKYTVDSLLEIVKTLVAIRKDWRQEKKEEDVKTSMSEMEYEEVVLKEAEEIRKKREQQASS